MDKKNRTSEINTWKPSLDQIYVRKDGKLFVVDFPRFIPEAQDCYNKFLINKCSYENQLDLMCKYTNFFIAKYDTDMELIFAYYKLKFCIDGQKAFGPDDMSSLIDTIYEIMFTPTMVNKITAMVRDNYLDDIESLSEEKKKYLKNDRKHLESLEFTNMHIKILLRISFGMKIMSPVLFHYLTKCNIKIEKDSEIIYEFYKGLFDIFGWGENYELCNHLGEKIDGYELTEEAFFQKIESGEIRYEDRFEVDGIFGYMTSEFDGVLPEGSYYWRPQRFEIYNKLYVYVKAKIMESYSHNSIIYEQREIFGIDILSVVNQFTKKVLISENMVKYKFNEHWKEKEKKYAENIIGFNKTIIKFQISYFLKDQYVKNLTEITNTKNGEGLSGSDKLYMNLTKVDEGATILADINIETTIAYIKSIYGVDVHPYEVEYFKEHLNPCDLQIELLKAFYAPYFGAHRDLNLVRREDYIVLLIILKKVLLIDLALDVDNDSDPATAALPYILTANIIDKVSNKQLRNNRFIQTLEESEVYQRLITGKYRYIEAMKPGYIVSLLSSIINTRFTYCIPEAPQIEGQEIRYDDSKIATELLYFLDIA